jgi:uncharacterized protein YcnI
MSASCRGSRRSALRTRIPTGGKVATTAAELDVPEGVIVETLQAPAGWKYEVKRADDRIVSIVWQVDVRPGEFVEVAFVARNPRSGDKIVWTLRQKFCRWYDAELDDRAEWHDASNSGDAARCGAGEIAHARRS